MIQHAIERLGSVESLLAAADVYLSQRPKERKTLAVAAREFIAAKRGAKKSKPYVDLLAVTLNSFAAGRAEEFLDAVTTADVERWLGGNGWAQDTQIGYLKNLRTFFGYCEKRHYCPKNPAAAVENPEPSNKPPCILTPEEIERLFRSAERTDPGLIPYLALATFGGLRPWEARAIAKDEIREGYVHVSALKSKTRSRRLVSANDTLRAWLALGGDYQPARLRPRLEAVRAQSAPLNWGHDILRHSFVSYHYAIHGASKTAQEAGHSEQVLFQHYRELVPRTDAERFWSIRPCEVPSLGVPTRPLSHLR